MLSDDLLSHGKATLPSAHVRFTSEFGMGSGGSTQLLSLSKLLESRPGGADSHGVGRSEIGSGMSSTRRRVQGHLRLYGQATRIISTG